MRKLLKTFMLAIHKRRRAVAVKESLAAVIFLFNNSLECTVNPSE